MSTQPSTLIENLYVNNYLTPLNNAWQSQLDQMSAWGLDGVRAQKSFYEGHVKATRGKVFVIISDALRYEIAEECLSRIRALDRFEADLDTMLASLPSYTQLGMASLLPHSSLAISEADPKLVTDADRPTGSQYREKMLAAGRSGDRVATLRADELKEMRSDEAKAFVREHDVVYIYHNQIDAIGDKISTEDRVFEAAESTLDELVTLVKKLTSANASTILITADHGFIYQHRTLDESDFSIADIQGDVMEKNRRFIVGRALPNVKGMKHFTSAQLGLSGALDVLIPNSINRLRVSGAGSRYVHGGAALQEIVIPVLRVSKGRESDVHPVDVQIIANGKTTITSGQQAVTFYQVQPVTEKQKPRSLRAGIYAADDTLISDLQELFFEFTADSPRERELPRHFLLSRQADAYNQQDVFLRLDERVGTTTHYQEYASQRFTLRRGITSDFDF